MIRVEGRDTRAAIMRARDHTHGTVDLILEIAVTLLLDCPLARDEHIHRLKQSGTGAESYSLQLSDGRQFHFRPGPGGHAANRIDVFDKYRHGQLVTTLSTPQEIWDFFETLAIAA